MKFCGKYSGKYNKTQITVLNGSKVITPSKGTSEVTISEVGCGAYLITIVNDNNPTKETYNELAYLEDNVLRASACGGKGILSSYFEDNKLIIQISDKPFANEWIVINFSFKKCKC
jgi:hypothetical protein